MKETATLGFILLCLVLTYSILEAEAVDAYQTYDWNTSGNTRYQVSVGIANAQVDSPFNVSIVLRLTAKDTMFNETTAQWMQVILQSSEKPFHIESEKLGPNQKVILSTTGDWWREIFTFQISSSKYEIGKGQSFEVDLIYKVSINQTTAEASISNYVGDNTNDPLRFNLSIPLLAFQELVIIVLVLLAIVIIIPQYIYWRRRERRMKEAEKPPEEQLQ